MISILLLLSLWLHPDTHAPDCSCDGCCLGRTGDTCIDLTPVQP